MQNNTIKMGRRKGTHNKEKNKAGGVKKGAGMEKNTKLGFSLGSFLMNQILSALCKHMSNLVLHKFQISFELNVILMDRLFITPELLQKNN
jgi:hypothetical protein